MANTRPLRSPSRWPLLPFLALAAACSGSSGTVGATVTFNPAIYVGSWTGTWTNTTTSISDAVTVTVEREGMRFLVEFDLAGEVFGVGDPAAENYVVGIEPVRAVLAPVTSPVYGALTGRVNDAGALFAEGADIDGDVDRFELAGTTNGTQLTVNVTITMDGGAVATANALLFKQ
jgi:hypothetical protein